MTGNKRDWSKQHCCHENSDVCSLLPSSMVTSHPWSVTIELTLLSQHECDLPLNTHIDVLSCICNVMSTGRLCRLYRNLGWCYIWVMEFPFIFIYTYSLPVFFPSTYLENNKCPMIINSRTFQRPSHIVQKIWNYMDKSPHECTFVDLQWKNYEL